MSIQTIADRPAFRSENDLILFNIPKLLQSYTNFLRVKLYKPTRLIYHVILLIPITNGVSKW